MPLLANQRHERFAQEIAKGKTGVAAYIAAGFNANSQSRRVNASRLLASEAVKSRVSELLAARATIERRATEKAVDAAGVDRAWILAHLKENAQRALQAIPVPGPDGEPCGEYRYDGNVANRALELLGKELGMFIDRKSVDIKRSYTELSDDELAFIAGAGGTGADEAPRDPAKLN